MPLSQSSGLAGGLVEQASWTVARRYDRSVGWPVQRGKAVQLNTAEVAARSVASVAEWVLRCKGFKFSLEKLKFVSSILTASTGAV